MTSPSRDDDRSGSDVTAPSRRTMTTVTAVALCVALTACASIARRDPPSISHVHIGHAITAWPLTPNRQGLLVVAETESVAAASNAELMLEAAREGDLARAKRYLREVVDAVDPTLLDPDATDAYGLRRATAEAVTHLKLASEVPDASANVRRTVTRGNVRATRIVDRADELVAFMDAGLKSEDVGEMEIIAEEIALALRQIAGGPDLDGVYGLYEFREEIESMVAREDPPYETVDSWYLFNLVKLPSGEWAFTGRRSRGVAGAGY